MRWIEIIFAIIGAVTVFVIAINLLASFSSWCKDMHRKVRFYTADEHLRKDVEKKEERIAELEVQLEQARSQGPFR